MLKSMYRGIQMESYFNKRIFVFKEQYLNISHYRHAMIEEQYLQEK